MKKQCAISSIIFQYITVVTKTTTSQVMKMKIKNLNSFNGETTLNRLGSMSLIKSDHSSFRIYIKKYVPIA